MQRFSDLLFSHLDQAPIHIFVGLANGSMMHLDRFGELGLPTLASVTSSVTGRANLRNGQKLPFRKSATKLE